MKVVPKSLLSGCIPDLELDLFAVDRYHASAEFYSYGEIVYGLETFVGELEKDT